MTCCMWVQSGTWHWFSDNNDDDMMTGSSGIVMVEKGLTNHHRAWKKSDCVQAQ